MEYAGMISVDLGRSAGQVKPMHGICNGPISNNGTMDLSAFYRRMGFPYVRLHDTDCNDTRCYVDISRIFPNFDADENDPSQYLFQHTDRLLSAIDALPSQVIYRLGESIDHDVYKRYARPPRDFDKWARICLNIVRHYNEGWAGGYRLGIRFWEIWNEPDCLNADGTNPMWCGGAQQDAFRLYQAAAPLIKNHDPSLMIGGMAFTSFNAYARQFVDFCAEKGLPLDFLSYHLYCDSVQPLTGMIRQAKAYTDQKGFPHTLHILDEWNYLGLEEPYEGDIWVVARDVGNPKRARQIYLNQKSHIGLAFTASCMMAMNHTPLDIATYYDGQPRMHWCGLMDCYAVPQPACCAFEGYHRLYLAGNELATQVSCPQLQAMAAGHAGDAWIMIANYRGESGRYVLRLDHLPGPVALRVSRVSDDAEFVQGRAEYYSGTAVEQTLYLDRYDTVLIHLISTQA